MNFCSSCLYFCFNLELLEKKKKKKKSYGTRTLLLAWL